MAGTVRLAGMIPHSMVDGPGIRFVLFFQGCKHKCAGCHNSVTHDLLSGTEYDLVDIAARIKATKYIDGITLSGGEPFLQPEACAFLAAVAKKCGLNVWCYTGWTFEELLRGTAGGLARNVLQTVDVLVDGRFIEELKPDSPEDCLWRGSRNQRLIDASASMQKGMACLLSGSPG